MTAGPGELVIITGPPGAGKSTVATLAGQSIEPSVVVTGDSFFGFLASGGIDPWLPESNEQNGIVTDAAAAATGRFVAGGYTTIYDGVLGPWYIDRFLAGLDQDGGGGVAAVDYVILAPPVETCVQRVRTRHGHAFGDEAATIKMHDEFARATIDRRHLIDNRDLEPDETLAVIQREREAGNLRYPAGGTATGTGSAG